MCFGEIIVLASTAHETPVVLACHYWHCSLACFAWPGGLLSSGVEGELAFVTGSCNGIYPGVAFLLFAAQT